MLIPHCQYYQPSAAALMSVCAYHLLGDHDYARSLGGTAIARDGEQLDEAREEVVRFGKPGFNNHTMLLIQLSLNVINISCSLKRGATEPKKGFVRFVRLAFLEVPPRRPCDESVLVTRLCSIFVDESGKAHTYMVVSDALRRRLTQDRSRCLVPRVSQG